MAVLRNTISDTDISLQNLTELNALISDPTSDEEMRALAEADITSTILTTLPKLSSSMKAALIPPHPFAHLPALIEIHPGAGGSEASIFADELLTAYTSLCSRLSWRHSLTDYTPDEGTPAGTTGLTSAILEISHPSAYNILRTEAGVHRVQRVPATEKKGRTHTSAVSVLVLPSLPTSPADSSMNYDDPTSDYHIAHGDVRSETMRASGAGGQHVNKTDSAIRLTHTPTGLVVAMQESRSQHSNREKAWNVLRAKLAQRRREEREAKMIALRRGIMGGVARTGREDKIRTYNFSQNRVSDHRCGAESSDLDGIMGGGDALEGIMDKVREWMVDNEVMIMAAEEEAGSKAKA